MNRKRGEGREGEKKKERKEDKGARGGREREASFPLPLPHSQKRSENLSKPNKIMKASSVSTRAELAKDRES